MYEIIIDGSLNPNRAIENEKLRNATALIDKAMKTGKQAIMCVAFTLAEIDKSEMYLLGGFKSMKQYASTMLDMSETTTRKYIRVGKMINKKSVEVDGVKREIFVSVFAKGEKDFTVGHLIEIENSIKEVETVDKLIDNGVITFDMSTKKVREICKAYKNGDIDDNGNNVIEASATVENEENGENNKKSSNTEKSENTTKEIKVEPKTSENAENMTAIDIVHYMKKYAEMYDKLAIKDKEIEKAVKSLLKAINK